MGGAVNTVKTHRQIMSLTVHSYKATMDVRVCTAKFANFVKFLSLLMFDNYVHVLPIREITPRAQVLRNNGYSP